MTLWGEGDWGIDFWGLGAESEGGVTGLAVKSADVYAHDMIMVEFNQPMKNDAELQSAANYTVTPNGDGEEVNVLEVKTGKSINPRKVFLIVSGFTIGEEYTIAVSANPKTTTGSSLDSDKREARFVGRRTKIDSMIDSRPKFYDTTPDSTHRAVLVAIGREDDLIGGSRSDRLP